MEISIITPTIRTDGLEIVRKSLLKQSFKNWEWLIGSKFNPKIKEARWVKDDFEGGFWTLNRTYNKLIREAKGKLIVSWQDNIYVPSTGLQQFLDTHTAKPHAILSGVGDQYEQLDDFGRPFIKIWADPRKRTDLGSFYEINWVDCEFNWALIPKNVLFEVGGFDERLDFLGYGGDQFQLCERLNDLGKHFFIDQSNESFTLAHTRDAFGGQEIWDNNHVLFNGQYVKRRADLQADDQWPVLEFLK